MHPSSATPLPGARLAPLGRHSGLAEARALWAVIRREWLHFVRYPTWVVALVVWPVIFPAAYILLARAMAGPDGSQMAHFSRAAGTTDYIGYIVIGTTVWMWQNVSLWQIGLALRNEQMRGTMESNWLTPARRLWFLLGAGIIQGAVLLVMVAVSALEFGLFFGVRLNGQPGLVLLAFLAATPAVYGLGFAFASIVLLAKEANAFVFLVRGLVMLFCGITYPIAVLPGWMQAVSAWLPPTYAIRAIRNAALAGADLPTLMPDLTALLGWGVVWLGVGYVAFALVDARARRRGAIGQY